MCDLSEARATDEVGELNGKIVHERKRTNERKQRGWSPNHRPQLQGSNGSRKVSEMVAGRSGVELFCLQSRDHEALDSGERPSVVEEPVKIRRFNPWPLSFIGEEYGACIRRDPIWVWGDG